MPGVYNFYDEAIQPGLMTEAQRKGILGWTGEGQMRGGVPGGRAIYLGFDNNMHLNSDEHKAAAHVLHQRSRRMRDMIDKNLIHPKDLPAVQSELATVEAQRDQHMKRHIADREAKMTPSLKRQPVRKSEGNLIGTLRRLIAAIRQ